MKTAFLLLLVNLISLSLATAQRTVLITEQLVLNELYQYDFGCKDSASTLEVTLPLNNAYQTVSELKSNISYEFAEAENIIFWKLSNLLSTDTLKLAYTLRLEPQLHANQHFLREPGFLNALKFTDHFRGKELVLPITIDTGLLDSDLDLIATTINENLADFSISPAEIIKSGTYNHRVQEPFTDYQRCLQQIAKELKLNGIESRVVSGKYVRAGSFDYTQYLEVELAGKTIIIDPIIQVFVLNKKSIPSYHRQAAKIGNGFSSDVRVMTCGAEIDASILLKSYGHERSMHLEILHEHPKDTGIAPLTIRLAKIDSVAAEYPFNAHVFALAGWQFYLDDKAEEGIPVLLKCLELATTNYERSQVHFDLATQYDYMNKPKEAIYHLIKADEYAWYPPGHLGRFVGNAKIDRRLKFHKLVKEVMNHYKW